MTLLGAVSIRTEYFFANSLLGQKLGVTNAVIPANVLRNNVRVIITELTLAENTASITDGSDFVEITVDGLLTHTNTTKTISGEVDAATLLVDVDDVDDNNEGSSALPDITFFAPTDNYQGVASGETVASISNPITVGVFDLEGATGDLAFKFRSYYAGGTAAEIKHVAYTVEFHTAAEE